MHVYCRRLLRLFPFYAYFVSPLGRGCFQSVYFLWLVPFCCYFGLLTSCFVITTITEIWPSKSCKMGESCLVVRYTRKSIPRIRANLLAHDEPQLHSDPEKLMMYQRHPHSRRSESQGKKPTLPVGLVTICVFLQPRNKMH